MALYLTPLLNVKNAVHVFCDTVRDEKQPVFDNSILDEYDGRMKVISRLDRLHEASRRIKFLYANLAAAERQIEEYRQNIHHQVTYINVLPPEILHRVFSVAYYSLPMSYRARVAFSKNISHVSQSWRHVTLRQSELWTFVRFNHQKHASVALVDYMSRSGSRPFNFQLISSSEVAASIHSKNGVPPHESLDRSRCQSLDLSLCNVPDVMHRMFTHQLPILNSVILPGSAGETDHWIELNHSLSATPALRRVVFTRARLHAVSFPSQLVEIIISSGEITAESLAAVFESCPMLETCQLHSISPSPNLENLIFKTPRRLKTLVITYFSEGDVYMHLAKQGRWENVRRLAMSGFGSSRHTSNRTYEFLSFFRNVTELFIETSPYLVGTILKILSRDDKNHSGRPVLPRLEVFTLETQSRRYGSYDYDVYGGYDDDRDWADALSLFASRRGSSVSRDSRVAVLRSITIIGVSSIYKEALTTHVAEVRVVEASERPEWYYSPQWPY